MSELEDLPPLLAGLHRLPFPFAGGDGYDYIPFDRFMPPDDVQEWLALWTGNADADGRQFLPFAKDGSGGLAAFWRHEPAAGIDSMPIVLLGSEGERGVVAASLKDYVWLLASGLGPMEAVLDLSPAADEYAAPIRDYAGAECPNAERPAEEILRDAAERFPDFSDVIDAMCR